MGNLMLQWQRMEALSLLTASKPSTKLINELSFVMIGLGMATFLVLMVGQVRAFYGRCVTSMLHSL